AVAVQDDGAHARRLGDLLGGGENAFEHRAVQRVVLVRPVQRDHGDVVLDLDAYAGLFHAPGLYSGIETRTPSSRCSGPDPLGPAGLSALRCLAAGVPLNSPSTLLYGPGLGRGLPPGNASRMIVRLTIPHCLRNGPVV